MTSEETGPPQGSLGWYAQLFCPESQRGAIHGVHDLWSEIRGISLRMQDPTPARMRLAWWGEELGLLAEGRPRHPAALRLLAYCPRPERAARLLGELLVAGEDDISGAGCENTDEFRLQAFRSDGAPLALLCELLGAPEELAVDVGREAGIVIAANRALATLGADLHHGLRPLAPWPLLKENGLLDTSTSSRPEPSQVAPVAALLGQLAEEAAGTLERSAAGAGDALRFTRLLARLHAAEGARARRRLGRHVPSEPVRIGTFTRLYRAWRHAMILTREET